LQSAADGSKRPGLWISERCVHLLQTLPEAPRSPHRAEDVDPRWRLDHWLDGLIYGVVALHGQPSIGNGRTLGWY
jgi:hypothetical protein